MPLSLISAMELYCPWLASQCARRQRQKLALAGIRPCWRSRCSPAAPALQPPRTLPRRWRPAGALTAQATLKPKATPTLKAPSPKRTPQGAPTPKPTRAPSDLPPPPHQLQCRPRPGPQSHRRQQMTLVAQLRRLRRLRPAQPQLPTTLPCHSYDAGQAHPCRR